MTGERSPQFGRNLARDAMRLAWPAVLDGFLATFTGAVALTMIGHLGAAAIAGVGLGNYLSWFLMTGFIGLSAGTTAIVARHIGAGEPGPAARATEQALFLSVTLSLVLAVPGALAAPRLLSLMGAAPDAIVVGTEYMRIALFELVPVAAYMTLTAASRAAGDTRTPLLASTFTNLVNLALLFVLIDGNLGLPALGVKGAAVSLVASHMAGTAVMLAAFYRNRLPLRFEGRERRRWDLQVVRRLLRVGLPSAGEQLLLVGGNLLFTRLVAGLGTAEYAAHQIALNISMVTFLPSQGLGAAASALVGQSLGGGKAELGKRYGYEVETLTLGLTVPLSAVLLLLQGSVFALYTVDTEVLAFAPLLAVALAVIQPAVGTYYTFAGGLRGAGDTRWALYVTATGVWAFRLTLGYLLAGRLGLGLAGVWIAICADHWARAIFAFLRFRSGKWQGATV